jgi:hypothetical protein
MPQISIQDAEFQFAGILSEVLNGEEVILTDQDSPSGNRYHYLSQKRFVALSEAS